MKLLKIVSILLLLPLFWNMVALTEAPPQSPKSRLFEKKWVKKLELRAQKVLEKKGIVLDSTATDDNTRSNITMGLGIGSIPLFILSFLGVTGSVNRPDSIVALATVGVLVAFLMSVTTFIVGRRLKNRKAKTGKIFAGVNLLLVALLLLLVIIAFNSGD